MAEVFDSFVAQVNAESSDPPNEFEKHVRSSRQWEFDVEHWEDVEDKKGFEEKLFGEARVVEGIEFGELIKMRTRIGGWEPPSAISSFPDMNLDSVLLNNINQHMRYRTPTTVQQCVIPTILAGRDLIACSQTGTGKTASFLIPIIQSLIASGRNSCADPRPVIGSKGLRVVCPRYQTWIRPAAVHGGVQMGELLSKLHLGAHILCATKGKLIDLMDKRKISLKKVRFVVLDEADDLLINEGANEVIRILMQYDLPRDESKQISVFSATFPKEVRVLAMSILLDPVLITVEQVSTLPKNLKQSVLFVEEREKFDKLLETLYNQEAGQTLIFTKNATMVDTLDDALYRKKFPVTSIHGQRTQAEREDSILAFRSNKTPIMVATSLASRGLDIPNVIHVINYDCPNTLEEYVHRAGRTARVGNSGRVTTFFNMNHEALACTLARVLEKYDQEVPEFLAPYLVSDTDKPGDVLEETDAQAFDIPNTLNALLGKPIELLANDPVNGSNNGYLELSKAASFDGDEDNNVADSW